MNHMADEFTYLNNSWFDFNNEHRYIVRLELP